MSGGVAGEAGNGLGPTFNANSCASCHAEPDVGGTSPHPTIGFVRKPNPQVAFATLDRAPGRNQTVPSFITATGPVREARFIQNPDGSLDGGVHGLYTIAGRIDAPGCNLPQPDFATQLANGNVIFRIPTPVFGLGLIENVPDSALRANLSSGASVKQSFGVAGRFNTTGNDGTITRFGWKAQNKSLLIFAGEAYNVEQGVANEVFGNERSAVPGCVFNPTPEDSTNITVGTSTTGTASQMSSDTVNFAAFMRLTAAPTPVPPSQYTASQARGSQLFGTDASSAAAAGIGCVLCHSRTLHTAASPFTLMGNIDIQPFSDIAIHHMSFGLADFVNQGDAGFDEFRTAPLWGVGQRIFFLHDGSAGPSNGGLVNAILQHDSTNPFCFSGQTFDSFFGMACVSEASQSVQRYRGLSASDQQAVLNFLRTL
ncbi:MAG TPA: di-heme oxidoredictase family protein [Myxococcaceae bacterium]|nr:di-heme oxidoredictase family protein [Myxococcaceae bacterium]